jgi:hypothetical protein
VHNNLFSDSVHNNIFLSAQQYFLSAQQYFSQCTTIILSPHNNIFHAVHSSIFVDSLIFLLSRWYFCPTLPAIYAPSMHWKRYGTPLALPPLIERLHDHWSWSATGADPAKNLTVGKLEDLAKLGGPGACPPENFWNLNPGNAISCVLSVKVYLKYDLNKAIILDKKKQKTCNKG